MLAEVYVCILIVNCVVFVTESARILAYYPAPSFSHQIVFRVLTNELVRRGHHVTVITTDPQYPKGQSPDNLTEVDIQDLSYGVWRNEFVNKAQVARKNNLRDQIEAIFQIVAKCICAQLEYSEVKKVIDKQNEYDLLIVEAFPRMSLVLSHIFKIPMIQFSSYGSTLDNYKQNGIPQHELLYPTMMRRKLHRLTDWEKMKELSEWFSVTFFYDSFEKEENLMLRKIFGNNVPTLTDLSNNIDMIFLNMHPMFEGIRPMPPNVVHLHGIKKSPVKELPMDLKKYLDASKHGVIYVSFGTNVKASLLPPDKIEIFNKVFSNLPYDILFKWDEDEMKNRSKNIKISKWFPQSDLLRHPKIKLFITQGGLQSTDESIEAGVPLIGMPMLGDQWLNVEQYVFLKIGIRLDLELMTEDNLNAAIKKVIGDSSYRNNIATLRSRMKHKSEDALERAIQWVNFIIRNGGKHFRPPTANLHWMYYYEMDIVAMSIAFVVSLAVLFMIVIRLSTRFYGSIMRFMKSKKY